MPSVSPSSDDPAAAASAPDWFADALAAPAEDGRVFVDGAAVHYRVWDRRGTGDPSAEYPPGSPVDDHSHQSGGPGILLVHGGGAHAHWWDHIAPQLAHTHRVAALDLTGHGDSDARSHYALEQWADELLAVSRASGLGERPVIVGHSMGGMVTYIAAHRHRGELGGVQIIDSPIRPRTPEEETRRGAALGRDKKVYPDVDTALAHFRLIPSQPVVLPYVARHVGRMSLGSVDGGWSWKFDPAMVTRDGSDLLGAGPPACPLAFLRAEDGILSEEVFTAMRTRFGPRALVTELPHTGHHPMADRPLLLIAVVRATLAAWAAALR